MRRLSWAALALAACGSTSPAPRTSEPVVVDAGVPDAPPSDAAPAPLSLDALEADMLAHVRRIDFTISAEGPYPAELAGRAVLEGDVVHLTAKGTFGGKAVELDYTSKPPTQPREALVIGWLRMGLLHNVSELLTGSGIDHAEGGVRTWVVPTDIALSKGTQLDFGLTVGGAARARSTLIVGERDPTTGSFTLDHTTRVRFGPGGDDELIAREHDVVGTSSR